MGAGHAHLGYVERDSWLHRTPAHYKVPATLLVVLAAVAVPAGTWWPFVVVAAVPIAAARSAGLPPLSVARRMLIELPFVVFAIALPFFAHGPRIDVLGLSVSRPGLIAAGGMLAKATIGVLAGIVLASTTRPTEMIAGLQRLRMPNLLVQIASFMLRYFSVVTDDVHRMRIARESRCFSGSGLAHTRAVAAGAGALFVRSYERGERVHLAMLSRGYDGRLPMASGAASASAAALPRLAAGVAVAILAVGCAWVLR